MKKLGSWKYLLIFVFAIILIRIDVILTLSEKVWLIVRNETNQSTVADFGESPVIIRSDKNVELSPRQRYISFMDNFRASPDLIYREQAMNLFKAHPQIFAEKRDQDLEARIYSWRDLIVQNEAEVPLFLLDLFNILRGENKLIITQFFSVVLDLNAEMFMANYPRTKDATCAPVTMIEAAVPVEEKLPELYERVALIEEYLKREDLPADKKIYANLCLNTLKIYLEKEAPAQQPSTEAVPEETPQESPASTEPPAGTNP